MTKSNVHIGADVGGTNTDITLVKGEEEYQHKLSSTDDPSKSTAEGVFEVTKKAGIEPSQVDNILHGTTVATNALIENEGAKTGLITTEGFRDVLHIGRHRKPESFSIQQSVSRQETPLVKRKHRKTVSERIYPPGTVVEPLNEDEVKSVAKELVEEGVESIAVCYLHSYFDTSHEDRTKQIIQNEFPEVFVSTSNEVVAQHREYERFSTTAINARIAPVMSNYLDRLQSRLIEYGFEEADVLIMQSNGGMASIREISKKPVTTLLSGPAAGVLSGESTGESTNKNNLITLDMGGTSADISVLPGKLLERDPRDSEIEDYPVITPMLDVEAIGSGGGSIAWFDKAKGFNVGPKSAGANPGPACYNQGNSEPTITDAQLVLGRIDPETFLGGGIDINPELSKESIKENLVDHVDQERFSTLEKAAMSVLDVANNDMYRSVREQTVQRGYDPREYSLIGFGGAGPMHAVDIAESLDIGTILIPPAPGIASARGLMTGDVQYDNQITLSKRLEDTEPEELEERIDSLEKRGTNQLKKDGYDIEEDASFEKSLNILYEDQGYELNIEYPGIQGNWKDRLRSKFEKQHEQEYGHYFEEAPIELLNVRVKATAPGPNFNPPQIKSGDEDSSQAVRKTEKIFFGTSRELECYSTPRYDREKLRAGNIISGPAVVDQFDSTVVINPGWKAEVKPTGTLEITR